MVKASSNSIKQTPRLRLPDAAWEHHGQVLFGMMQTWRARKQIPPVLLITGQSGVGKRQVAFFLSQWILCENHGFRTFDRPLTTPAQLGPCGECPACKRSSQGNDVDFIEIQSETEESTTESSRALRIEQFRNIKTTVGYGAHESTHKMVLIPHADRMTVQAANSVLKLLEEPPRGWVFFLTASDSTLLLPTIVSRCQTLRLKPFPEDKLRTLLQLDKVDSQKIEVCASLAQGSWERALRFAENEIWEKRSLVLQFFEDPLNTFTSLLDWAATETEHLEVLIDLLEFFTAELLRWTSASESCPLDQYKWRQLDTQAPLSSHAKTLIKRLGGIPFAQTFWLERSEQLAQARHRLTLPLNRKLLIQDLLLPWIGAFS